MSRQQKESAVPHRQRFQRRATDRQAASRGRDTINRRIIAGAILVAAAIGAVFVWQRVGSPPVRDGAPNWSPDGTEIVYFSEQPDGKADLFVMSADGTRVRRLTTTADDDEGGPAFSPDGSSVAFDTDRDGNFEIYIVGADGTGPRRVTDHPGRDVAPAWSPDGRSLVFMSDRERSEFDVFRIDVDGTGLVRLTRDGSNWFPQFAPVAPERIAMHVWRDVHVLDPVTSELTRLTTAPRDGMYPTWSPDGSQIAFMSARNGRTEIFTMNADGSDQRRLVAMATGSAIDPRWSPAGTHVAFVHVPEDTADAGQDESHERAIYVVEIATGRLTRLSR